MISVEANKQVFSRARFNRPFGNINVIEGLSEDVLPDLIDLPEFAGSSFVVWLDFDGPLTASRLDELLYLVEHLPDASALLTTFNAQRGSYADSVAMMQDELESLLGREIVGNEIDGAALAGNGLMATLADRTLDKLKSAAIRSGRAGGFVPSVRLLYRDSTNMVTIGGFLPAVELDGACRDLVGRGDWCGIADDVIATQPLTVREVQALSQLLPSDEPLSAADVKALGFELDPAQIRAFEKHYLRYPLYAELR